VSEAVIAVALVWVAASGTAVVLTRDPLPQAFVAGFFGLGLAFLYLSLQAGDVALSQIVVDIDMEAGMALVHRLAGAPEPDTDRAPPG